jgi:hypothetical protein
MGEGCRAVIGQRRHVVALTISETSGKMGFTVVKRNCIVGIGPHCISNHKPAVLLYHVVLLLCRPIVYLCCAGINCIYYLIYPSFLSCDVLVVNSNNEILMQNDAKEVVCVN